MDRLVIDRKIWERGGELPLLLNDDPDAPRQQCCVGIYLTALGVPDDALCGLHTADNVEETGELPEEASWLVEHNRRGPSCSAIADSLYEINDATYTSHDGDPDDFEMKRETEIARLFREGANIAVEFTD